MSYILDALRRADAERERGAVPGLQSQQHTIAEDDAATTRPRRLVWVVAASSLALVAVLAWAFLGGGGSTSRSSIEGSVVPAPLPVLPSAQAPLPAAVGTAAPPGSGTATVPPIPQAMAPATAPPIETRAAPAAVPMPATRPTPAAMSERPQAPSRAAPVERATTRSSGEARPPQQRGADASAPAASATAAAPNAGAARVYTQAELPEEIRRDLPKIVIGGSSYSGDAASRMIMVNGQVFHEGDRLAPGLVLERIRQKSAVLSFKGWQYEVMF